MTQSEIAARVKVQRAFFRSGATRALDFRLHQLARLKETIRARENDLYDALKADLNKPEFEVYVAEVSFVYNEISHLMKELGTLASPKRVSTPLILQPATSRILYDPLGVVLIIGPWNYPFQLLLSPLAGALAAGNCAVLKPSEFCSHTSTVVREIIEAAFPADQVVVIEGGVETAKACLAQAYDHIFFTGGPATGRAVMEAAAKNLTPVTLELGGKSPCVVHHDAPLRLTARRIAWGKYMNAGQTCIAPDYLLVHEKIASGLIDSLSTEIRSFFGADPQLSPDYARIVNERHFERLLGLLRGTDIVVGGQADAQKKYIAPTIVKDPGPEHRLMQEEIFGPILPVLTYRDLDEAFEIIARHPKPLAFYFFSSDKRLADRVMTSVSFGGGCVNDVAIHIANPHLPFGGVGASGFGAYHGRHSFTTFSHQKSVLFRSFNLDAKFRYPPYAGNIKYLKWLES